MAGSALISCLERPDHRVNSWSIHPVHEAQLLTYLRLTRHKIGLLMNFNCSA